MAKIENRNGLYSLAYDNSNSEGWQKPWGIAQDKCFAQPGPMTPTEALRLSRADFVVQSRPALAFGMHNEAIEAPGYSAQVRTDLNTVVGLTGDRYTPVQYSEVLGMLEGTSFKVDAAAVLDGGSRFYFQARLSRDAIETPNGSDWIDTYLTGLASHDGSSGVVLGRADTRIVCANTLAKATIQTYKSLEGENQVEGTGKAKHTKNVGEKLADIASALRRIEDQRKAQLALYGKLAATKVGTTIVHETIAHAFPSALLDSGKASEGVAGATRVKNVRERVLKIFETGEHSTPRDGTAWSLWQAVTAYMSHESGVRGVQGVEAQTQRWLRSTLEGNAPSERALKYLATVS